jgi:xanthine phosphoribosyltransferase
MKHPRPPTFEEITAQIAHWPFPEKLDGVVGIASGGAVPAALVAQRLGLGLKMIALNYRDEANEPRFTEPRVVSVVPSLGKWRRVLLVDDIYISGKSWNAARAVLPKDVEVLPFVLWGKAEFALLRDYHGTIDWPWQVA